MCGLPSLNEIVGDTFRLGDATLARREVAVGVPEMVASVPLQPAAGSVNSVASVCYAAVAVTMPHIQFRHTQSISEKPALPRSAVCSVSVV